MSGTSFLLLRETVKVLVGNKSTVAICADIATQKGHDLLI
jgi:hypothetical protein